MVIRQQWCHAREFLFVLIALTLIFHVDGAAAAAAASVGGTSNNPYTVLGVERDATQDEIRRRYRDLCLKYHPDKNVGKSEKERTRLEEQFKRVQKANSQIGDEQSRRDFDSLSAFDPYGGGGRTGSPHYGSSASEAFFRSFYEQQRGRSQDAFYQHPFYQYTRNARPRTPFYFNGVDISNLFHGAPGQRGGFFGSPATAGQSGGPKSVYVEKVKVPLEDLYGGKVQTEFVLHDNIWQRYRAAFRGGVAGPIALQGFFASLTVLLRASLPVTAAFFVMFFHFSLPRPTKLFYAAELKQGWKGGTRLRFDDVDPGFTVVFVLEEQSHDRFVRRGDDLHTTVTIGKSRARDGCVVLIDPLSEEESPISMKLHPGEITHDGQLVTVKGKGWPRRRGGGRGDLVVTVNVVADKKEDRRKGGKRKKDRVHSKKR